MIIILAIRGLRISAVFPVWLFLPLEAGPWPKASRILSDFWITTRHFTTHLWKIPVILMMKKQTDTYRILRQKDSLMLECARSLVKIMLFRPLRFMSGWMKLNPAKLREGDGMLPKWKQECRGGVIMPVAWAVQAIRIGLGWNLIINLGWSVV